MRISALVPFFNRMDFLRECIDSILAQTLPCAEIVMVDDGSTDGSAAIVREIAAESAIPIRLVCHDGNRGIAAARNTALGAASGNWIAFLDSDDVWHPEKNAIQREAIEASGGARICTSDFEEFFSPEYEPTPGAKLKADAGILPCSMLCERTVFGDAGLFVPGIKAGEFIEWIMRARSVGIPEIHVKRRLFRRRVHGHNSVRAPDRNEGYLRAVRLAMAAKRAAGGT